MSALTPEGRALIEAGRKALRPSIEDRERVLHALHARLPPGGLNPGAAAPVAGKATVGLVAGAATVGAAVVAALIWTVIPGRAGVDSLATASATPRLLAPPPETTSLIAPAATATASGQLPPALPVSPAADDARSSPTRRPSDRLAEEVALLSRAQADLHAGRFSAALSVLAEHRRKFPRGTLAQERSAARVRALCALGRTAEADAEVGVLTRSSPKSLYEGQARAACAASSPK